MVHGSQNRGSWASWGPTIIFSEKKSPYLNNLSLDHIYIYICTGYGTLVVWTLASPWTLCVRTSVAKI